MYENNFRKLLSYNQPVLENNFREIVKETLKKKDLIKKVAQKYETPFYIFDKENLLKNIHSFQHEFSSGIPRFQSFYAMKCNPHPFILQTVIKTGMGIDVSSGKELSTALEWGAKQILFTGPAKTEKDLLQAIIHAEKVTINIDSFSELRKLGKLTALKKKSIKAGVRIFTSHHGSWNKFGIPLSELKKFLREVKQYPYVDLKGIQVHMSFNTTPDPYVNILKQLAEYIRNHLSPEERKRITFIDFGGGFIPQYSEVYYPWELPKGKVIKTINDYVGKPTQFSKKWHVMPTVSLAEYAKEISQTIKNYLMPLIDVTYYAEPGRVIAHEAMHIVLKVADVKGKDYIITDGGTNMVGWEKFEQEYCPVINITHPSPKELSYTLYGSLCTPQDIWGYSVYATSMKENDILVIPHQGAYIYTYAQNFIKPIPNVYPLK